MNILSSSLCIFATLLLFGVEDVTSHGCGDIHSQLCLTTMRMNLALETRFWYNVNYTLTCPKGSDTGPWECINMDPLHTSLITRMRNSTSNDTSMISKILNVTWYVDRGAYEACFNTYTPGLVNWTIDPSHPTHQPLWSLLEMPSITWDADPGMNHTLIFWDSGALMLRGLYINIEGQT
ncbi:uncharacterized protein LOC112560686 [Pomacea canaliculata]|uniref:uncharacterized protein LOC112560686 n=1 Tax=Pomacea canaliculata TaxID=400727 RepID=UPI000D7340DE|nr:uncharacterized protein LOC112560686 [Pomacea canaliculata]